MALKVKKKKSGIRIFATLLLMAVIAAFVYKFSIFPVNRQISNEKYHDKDSIYSSLKIIRNHTDGKTAQALDKLSSPNVILIRLKDYTVIMQKNSQVKIYPASLTKIMTAIVAIESLPDLKEEIKLTNSAFQGLYEADASMAGFQPGEQVRAIDLLYGAILPSGAECCIGLADRIAGSEQAFVKRMNQKAAELGMENTHFENATGLHKDNHYTTVEDLAVLLCYALQNDTFQKIFTSSRHSTPPTNKHADGITVNSSMFEKLTGSKIIGGKILGGKTGYTGAAGLCLASLAKVNNQEYVLVTAGAKGDTHSEQYNISDAIAVYSNIGK